MGDISIHEFGRKFAMFYLPFLFSLCVHEFAHGLVAKWKGDNTAELMGRLTLNPMAHIDWLGTVALPFLAMLSPFSFFFGWAKPVPVNPRNLSNQKNDMFWIALAGPLSNVILALIGALVFAAVVASGPGTKNFATFQELFFMFIGLNLILAVFNMIPFHPLDGGKIVARFLPRSANNFLDQMEPYSLFIILGFFFIGGGAIIFTPVYYATSILMGVAQYAGQVVAL